MIDYMQLMDNPGVESRQQQISEISRAVKSVARELNIPVICLSQLNRASEGRDGHRPRMSDLRESGSIEQDADVIMLLHREDYYKMSEPDFQPDNIAEVIIAKQRNGPTGTIKLTFLNRTTRFENLSTATDGFA
jgi:replicative DNA helicase